MHKIRNLIEKIYDHVENGDVDKAVFACIRLSRNMGDVFNTVIFLRELHPDKKQINRAFYEETEKLNEKSQKHLWEITTDYWIEGRTLSYSVSDDPDKTVLALGVGDMNNELTNIQESIGDLKTPEGMGEYDLAAFTDRYDITKAQYRLRLMGISTILERIRTRCLNYASRTEKQIDAQESQISFLNEVQNQVNSYFSSRSDETYKKLLKATSLLESPDTEDNALLLTAIRRAIHSVSDYFYQPKNDDIVCADGKTRKMGKEQYLNRLHEFCSLEFKSSTSNDLINAELDYLLVFARKLNDISSKGVHAEVTSIEAKQGLVGLYLFLSNVIQKIESNDS